MLHNQSHAKLLTVFHFRMYDIDGNGSIDQKEIIKIVQGIYDMIGMVICDIKFLREGHKIR